MLTTTKMRQNSHNKRKCRVAPPGHWPYVLVMLAMACTLAQVESFLVSTIGESPQLGTACAAKRSSSTSSSSASKEPVTVVRRKAKHKKRKKSTISSSSSLTEEELRNHVATMYINGPGGVLRDTAAKARRSRMSMVEERKKQLQRLDRLPALVLNADYQPTSYLPLSIWHWQETAKAVFSGKVTVVETYPDVFIRAANFEIPLPSVIALNEYVRQPHNVPAFTKRNVFLRDEYRCQYCNNRFQTRDLSLDHVIPRCRGGRLSWDNAVTSCRACNGRKGSLTVNQLQGVGMRLMKPPHVPTQYQLHSIAGRMLPRRVHPSWSPYLGIVDGEEQLSPNDGVFFERPVTIAN